MKTSVMALGLLLALPSFAETLTLTLKEFDQIKLGELLGKLPADVALVEKTILPDEADAYESKVTFPERSDGFKIVCRRTFYNNSPYPSFTKCTVTVDLNHQNVDKHYDEVKVPILGGAQIKALYEAIPYGKPRKEYYSFGRDDGTSYEGKKAEIFHYRLSCSKETCAARFSLKSLVDSM